MNRLHFLWALLLFALNAPAQQLSLFTQYRENLTVINPAAVNSDYLGFEQNVTIGASYRTQWTSFPGNPTTQTVYGSYLNTGNNAVNFMGGGFIMNDQTGPTGFSGIYGRVAGVLSDDPYFGGFAVGLSAGLAQFRINASEIRLRDPNDVLGSENQTQLYPDVGVGIFAYQRIDRGSFSDAYVYGGISIPQVIGLDLTFREDNGDYVTRRVQHFYGVLGLYKFFDNNSFLEPSAWIKYAPNAPANVDFNLRYQLPTNFWIGTGVSTAGNFHGEAGFILGEMGFGNMLRIGYGFDYSFSTFGPATGPSHEVHISYSFER